MNSGQKIKRRREELGYSQSKLAELMGLKDRSSISKFEAMVDEPNSKTLTKLAVALKCTPADLLGDYEDVMANADTDMLVRIAMNKDYDNLCRLFSTLNDEHKKDIIKQMEYFSFLEKNEKG